MTSAAYLFLALTGPIFTPTHTKHCHQKTILHGSQSYNSIFLWLLEPSSGHLKPQEMNNFSTGKALMFHDASCHHHDKILSRKINPENIQEKKARVKS